ncbi:MAG TPA: HAD family hydrolase [Candidatus Limnocylindria bacterium]|nr:HAD family hydrolase [Candidatus Limnocylindria bacterium]
MRLRTVLFDMGGTLVETRGDVGDPWREPVLDAIKREFGQSDWAEALYSANIRPFHADEPHRQETNRWLAEWLRERGENFTDEQVERLRRAFARPIPAVFSLAAGAATALRWCKARELAVVVVTNTISRGDEEARGDFERFGVSELIDHVVSSYSTGWEKPHRAIFERALGYAGASAAEACNVGDRLDLDIAGPKALGMRAVWISADPVPPDFAMQPDATISSLEQLPAVLERWLR